MFCEKLFYFIILYQLLRFFIRVVYQQIYGPYFKPGVDFNAQGKWAVVTGSTDGLGKAYAKAFAEKGINIVLISRTMSKLKAVAEEIETNYKVETKVIQADFTEINDTYEHIEKNVEGLDVGILVNNVGMNYINPTYFTDIENSDRKIDQNILNCNISSVVSMSKIILPRMVEKKRGIIINISSTAGSIPCPMLAVYSSTKAFIDKFTTDLQTENKKHGIIFQSVQPGLIATNMSRIRKTNWLIVSPELYVENALKTVGVQEFTQGYISHTLSKFAIETMEYICDVWARQTILSSVEKVRAKALKKKVHSN